MSTVTVTATPEPNNVPPRIRLNISSADASSTTLTRLNPDGRTVNVRTQDGGPLPITSGTALIYDYEAPFGQAVQYSSVESPGTTSANVTLDVSSIWLVHCGVPDLSMPIELRSGSLQDESYTVQRGVFRPMGRDTPVIVTDGYRKSMESSLIVATDTGSEAAALQAILADTTVLFLNIPPSFGYMVDSMYISVADARFSRTSQIGSDPWRDVELPFSEVARPAGGTQAQRTYADVLVDNATYATLLNKYSTYAKLLAGP